MPSDSTERPTPSLSRRAFLGAGTEPNSIVDENSCAPVASPNEPTRTVHAGALLPASHLVTYGRSAMACEFEICVDARHGQRTAEAALLALDRVDALEDQLTVYRDTSEVIELNRRAAAAKVEVEAGLFSLLELAARVHSDSGHALDITIGPLSRMWGFHRRVGRLPTPPEIEQALQVVGWQHVQLNERARTIQFRKPGVEINVNSLGKGFALDVAATELQTCACHDFLLSGGKSSMLAGGSDAWTIGLRNPLWPERRLLEVQLQNAGLGTSGSATQYFRHEGQRYGHILDPRTGWPAAGVYSATAVAPTAAEADALSTAFYVMGTDAVEAYCRSHPDVGAILVSPTPSEGEVSLSVYGLAADQWSRCE